MPDIEFEKPGNDRQLMDLNPGRMSPSGRYKVIMSIGGTDILEQVGPPDNLRQKLDSEESISRLHK